MKIAVLGTSFSEGIYPRCIDGIGNATRGKEWVQIFSDTYPNFTIYNYAEGGLDSKLLFYSLYDAFIRYNPDYYIFESASLWRFHYGFDSSKNIEQISNISSNNNVFKYQNLNWFELDKINNVTYINSNHDSLCINHSKFERINSIIKKIKKNKKNNEVVSEKDWVTFALTFQELDSFSSMRINEIFFFKKLFQLILGDKILYIDWTPGSFINDNYDSVTSYLKNKYGKKWFENNIVDEGMHLTSDAHEIIANEYIIPKFQKLLERKTSI